MVSIALGVTGNLEVIEVLRSVCTYYVQVLAVLCKRPEHPQTLVPAEGPGMNPLQIMRMLV